MSGCMHEIVDFREEGGVCRGSGCRATWASRIKWMSAAAALKAGRRVTFSEEVKSWSARPVAPSIGFTEAWRLMHHPPKVAG